MESVKRLRAYKSTPTSAKFDGEFLTKLIRSKKDITLNLYTNCMKQYEKKRLDFWRKKFVAFASRKCTNRCLFVIFWSKINSVIIL